jgi:hypothetical protein
MSRSAEFRNPVIDPRRRGCKNAATRHGMAWHGMAWHGMKWIADA